MYVFDGMSKESTKLVVDVIRLNRAWLEGETDYAVAAPGEVTWRHAKYQEETWRLSGASHRASDREREAVDSQTLGSRGRVKWQVKSSVQDMIEYGTNFGWLLQARDETLGQYYRLVSSEHPHASWRPRLTIVAHVPSTDLGNLSEKPMAKLDGGETTTLPSVIEEPSQPSLPTEFSLKQNYPNPFNPSTTINFAVPRAGEITLKIYNLQGQLLRTLASGNVPAGWHRVVWEGTDAKGSRVASGIYVYRLEAQGYVISRKLTLMK